SITCVAVQSTAVVKKYSSRWLPEQSWTHTQRNAANPAPERYHCPVPVTTSTSRRPPPYQATLSRCRRLLCATTVAGEGNFGPFCRGRPFRFPPGVACATG